MRIVSACLLLAVLVSSSIPVAAQVPCVTGEILQDGDFENGLGGSSGIGFGGDAGPWHWTTADGILSPFYHDQDTPGLCHTGSWCIRFSQLPNANQTLSQTFVIPEGAVPTLTLWVKIKTAETSTTAVTDRVRMSLVDLNGNNIGNLADFTNLTPTPNGAWLRKTYNLKDFVGQQLKLNFYEIQDSVNPTLFMFDDISLSVACPTTSSACIDGANTLCLQGDRFKIEGTFLLQDNQGSGPLNFSKLTDASGYFTFTDPNDVQAVIKVLNQCGFTSTFWVFTGALTDQEVHITVTDTKSGDVKHYDNALHNRFLPIYDGAAFSTCP
jgi:hypothetical protein